MLKKIVCAFISDELLLFSSLLILLLLEGFLFLLALNDPIG